MSQDKPTRALHTPQSLAVDLASLGLQKGDTVLVHSSINSIGFVNGGSETIVRAILHAIGDKGTLVVPTHSIDNSDPSTWEAPDYKPVPDDWWQGIRESMPPYDPKTTPSRRMGSVPEAVRTWPGALRSGHPQTSFAAIGAHAANITSNHPLECRMGEDSPLRKLEDLEAKILFLGVGFEKCTAFHLAEYRADWTPVVPCSFAASVDGHREWMTVKDRKWDGREFGRIGQDLCEQQGEIVLRGKIGNADCYLFPVRESLKFAVDWFLKKKAT